MPKLKMVIPKGRIFESTATLLKDAGFSIETNGRVYVPEIGDPEIECKIMKPQNIGQLVEIGSHDVGFTGYDWLMEKKSRVTEIMDVELKPVKIVAAVPENMDEDYLKSNKVVVASEYRNISTEYLQKKKYEYLFIRSYGATEAFPPQDADMIIDNISTGRTLMENDLKVLDVIMESSTRFIANNEALKDKWKAEKIEELKMLFKAVINARQRVMLEMNVPKDKLEAVIKELPCMRAPTVSRLYEEMGYAVKSAVKRSEIIKLVPKLKKLGATDILEYEFKKVII